MKNQEKKNMTKANVKELALEKLRSTEGGRNIIDQIKEIIFLGGFFGNPPSL